MKSRFSALALVVMLLATVITGAPVLAARPGQLEDPGEPQFETAGWRTDFSITSVPYSEIVPGGPTRDGIPAIEAPRFDSIPASQGWLAGKAPVIALEIDGDARAYPLAILIWHEIANDVVGGVPVVVTFCPLCNTALVFERAVDGVVHDFGTTGNLRFSDLIMYDLSTESWWQQATGHAIVGDLTGTRLVFRAAQLISLDQFATAWPDGQVLTRETGFDRPYGDNPFAGFDSTDEQLFRYAGEPIDGILPKERVVTVGEGADAIAFPHNDLRAVGAANETVGDDRIVVFWEARTPPAGDVASVGADRDVGSTGVFSPIVEGRELTFARDGAEDAPIKDLQTGSTWTVSGHAVDGPLVGTRLEPIQHADHFWFAWAVFAPDTRAWRRTP